MRFADLQPGLRIEAGPCVVTREDVLAFAQAWDPQWFHVDEAAAAAGPFGGLIASGWHTCAMAMRLAVQAVLQGSEAFASPGISNIRWPHPVRPGDTLRLTATITDNRPSRSRQQFGVLQWRWEMHNQHGQLVLEADCSTLFKLGS